MRTLVDFNADAGESFGRWNLGADAQLIPLMSSVNIACGWHAGDPMTMRRSIRYAKENGVALGAHPGLPDLTGFGRRVMAVSPEEAETACLYQLGALRTLAAAEGVPVRHVKPHGALYGMTLRDPAYTEEIIKGVLSVDPELIVVLLAGPAAERGLELGARVAREAFADLDYDDEGRIIIEPNPQAKDPDRCAQQAIDILHGAVTSTSGKRIDVDADTICIHGDRPNAVDVAFATRRRFEEEGVAVATMNEVISAPPSSGHSG
jgi:5-oxoprolinase (ATP-hydrolysing) subunit A